MRSLSGLPVDKAAFYRRMTLSSVGDYEFMNGRGARPFALIAAFSSGVTQ
jgi:hypothetical protein